MPSHKLKVFNQSGSAKSYVLFLQPPSSPVSLINAWVTFDSVTSGGFDSVAFDDGFYAYWGTTPDTLGPGTVISSGGVAPVDLAQQSTFPFSGAAPLGFGAPTNGATQPGSFMITTAGNFMPDNELVVGVAKAATMPIPVPVATLAASPNMNYVFTPEHRIYVAVYAGAAPGQVIDMGQVSNTAIVDFTGRAKATATVIHGADGTFTIDYSA